MEAGEGLADMVKRASMPAPRGGRGMDAETLSWESERDHGPRETGCMVPLLVFRVGLRKEMEHA